MFHMLIFLCLTYWTSTTIADRKTALCLRKGHVRKHEISTKADSFKELIEDSSIFVDRTLLIKEIITNPNQVIEVTCMRKWGKTINLDMIKTFFEIEVDKHGNELLPKNTTRNHKLFQSGHITWMKRTMAWLNEPMLIARNESELFDKFQGQNPVILIDFNMLTGNSFIEMYKSLSRLISKVYQQHHYLGHVLLHKLNDHNITDKERELVQADLDQFNKFIFDQEINENVTCESLKFLTQLLYKHFNRKVYVLIDNYEAPILRVFYDLNFIRLYSDDVLDYYSRLLLFVLKNNEYLEKAIITGFQAIGNEYIFHSLDLVEYTAMHNPWAEFYGIEEDTVDDIIHQLHLPDDEHENVHIWYSGYEMGTGVEVHNPWSIVSYINFGDIRNFWFTPDDTLFLLKVLPIHPIREMIESLVNIENITCRLHKLHFSIHDIYNLRDLAQQQIDLKLHSKNVDLVIGRLWASGYLSAAGQVYEHGQNITYLELPNDELMDEMINRLFWLYQFKDGISPFNMRTIMDYFIKFIDSDHVISKPLAYELTNLLHVNNVYLPVSSKKAKEKEYQLNTKFLRSFMNYLALEFRYNHNFNVTVVHDPTEMPNLIMNANDIGVLVKFMFDVSSGKIAWQKVKQFTSLFNHDPHIKTIKTIGIGVNMKCNADIFAKITTRDNLVV